MTPLLESYRPQVAEWAELWGTPGLEDDVSVAFSRRLRTSLGRCRPALARVTLRADLGEGPAALLTEVLCHELAHVAAYRKHGRDIRPHGPEWRALISAAGFEPRVRLPAPADPANGRRPAPRPTGRRKTYEHRCPVCQAVRFARRPVRRWRCAACLDAGLGGELVITRRSNA